MDYVDVETEDEEYFVNTIDESDDVSKEDWKQTMKVNGQYTTFKLDTGAQVNLIPIDSYKKMKPKPRLHKTKIKLKGYSGAAIPVQGKCVCEIKSHGQKNRVLFYVVDSTTEMQMQPILGLKACEILNMVKRVYQIQADGEYKYIHTEYASSFEGVGCLPGTTKIVIEPNSQPVQDACRKVPFPLRGKLKAELDRMEKLGVIIKEDSPTDWVSSLCVVVKPSGDLRICLDPRNLNKVIKREHYKLPTREEVMAQLSGAKIFSKLDATSGFWQMKLVVSSNVVTQPKGTGNPVIQRD